MKQRTGRKLIGFLFALALVLGLMAGMSLTAYAASSVTYLDWNGSSLVEETCTDYIAVSGGSGQSWGTAGSETWYVVENDVEIKNLSGTSPITLNGPVHLIICDGKKLTINSSDDASATAFSCGGNSLTIHGQSGKTGTFKIQSAGNGIYLGMNGHEPLTIYGVNGEVSTSTSNYKAALSDQALVTVIEGELKLKATESGSAGAAGQNKIYVGDQTVVYASNDGMPVVGSDTPLPITESGDDKYVNPGGKKNVLITFKPHTHDFTYSASDATIKAACTEEGCNLSPSTQGGSDHAVTLTIAAPEDLFASSQSHTARLTGLDDFNTATGKSVAVDNIKYYSATRADDGAYSKTSETPLASAPNDKGDYIAEITLSGVKTASSASADVTASVGYSLVESYKIWIANELITSGNLSGTGWSYAADTNTLTLDGFSSTVCHAGDMHTAILYYVGQSELKIQFTGTNTLNASDTTNGGSGIYSNSGKIILEGSGTLDLKGKSTDNCAGVFMNSSAELIINKGTITAEGYNGFSGKTTINGGDVTATVTGTAAAALNGNLTNAIPGKGWKDSALSNPPVEIAISDTERYMWGYYKVHFLPAATLTTEPTGKDLTYTGSEQELITPGVIGEGATSILYAFGTDSETVPESGWDSYIPKATNPGINYVWYKVKGDETHSDSEPVCITVTIGEAIKLVFDSNGGTGTMEDQIVTKNQLTKVNSNRFTKDRYIFTGWNTKADGTGVSYEDKSEISVEATTTLYAQWEESKDHNHLPLKEVNAADPTCEEEGNKHYYECEICGKIFEDTVGQVELTKDEVIIKAIGHKWDDGVVTKEATYDETGIKTFTCENDSSHTKEEEIPRKTKEEEIPRKTKSEDNSKKHDSSSESSGSSGSSSNKSSSSGSAEIQAKVDQINDATSGIPENHQVETGVPASDVGGRWGSNANADTWTYTKSDGTLAKSEWMSLDYNGLRYWYYFNEDGNMLTNWFDYNGERFYLMPQKDGWRGRMATGWKNIDNKWYYFDIVPGSTQGKLYRGTITPDGHVVGADGAWNGVGETPVGQE
ncbi:InlB B-repeat-containing protein [Oribacterium sp. FC2011]|uniref:InlB B-repeat-containing protein n=1 Tax=Oribacterium sp. FC2011 TaxID=1408311 RepID=UPI0006796A80|nr:InlB B-repeat-containing protein [Oribacterium sp. FC2011]